MKKQALLLFSLLLFTGCVERGYNVTSNVTIHTVTAERVTSIEPGNSTTDQPDIEEKMFKDVKKTLKKQKIKPIQSKTVDKKTTLVSEKPKEIKKVSKTKTQEPKKVSKTKIIEPKKVPEPIVQEEKKVVPISKNDDLDEKNLLLEAARKSRELRQSRLDKALKEKVLARIEANKLAIKRLSNAKTGYKHVTKEEQKQKLEKIKESQENIEQNKKQLEQIKKAEEVKKEQDLQKKKMQEEAQQRAEEERHKLEQAQKAKEQQKQKAIPKVSNKKISTTEILKFTPINKVYQKFGTSEVHGRVIYLDNGGNEVRLGQTKVYLLPMSAKLNHWYTSYYLKNKKNKNNTTVNYLNKTSLNASKKFEFFGVPQGSYYVIIESIGHSNEKVYIAKKIKVGKYKKVMGVFSKKL